MEINNREKLGLVFFMIGLLGCAFNPEGVMFIFGLVVVSIGLWMFVCYDLCKAETPNKKQ